MEAMPQVGSCHSDGVNVAMADGSVEFVKPGEVSSANRGTLFQE